MTYDEIRKLVEGKELPLSAENENGENVIIEEGETDDGEHFYQLTTIQKNDWCRINTYYADGSIDESFEK